MKKTALAALAALAAVAAFSAPALAYEDDQLAVTADIALKGGIVNNGDGTVTKDSGNASAEASSGGIVANGDVTKDSGNVSVEADKGGIVSSGTVSSGSGNADDGSVVASGPVNTNKAEDGGIAATGNVKKVDIEGSFNKEELEVNIGDVNVMVSKGELSAEVANNRLEAGREAAVTTGNITNKGDAFSSATGITVVKSNTGINSSMQTSINVNANIAK